MALTSEDVKKASGIVNDIQEKIGELGYVISTAKRGMTGNDLIQKQFDAGDKAVLVAEYKKIKSVLVTLFQELPG